MTDTNTNTPAFPSTFHNGWGEPEKGMTLRDYLAAKAMQGVVASAVHGERINLQKAAEWSYAMADAMLKAKKHDKD